MNLTACMARADAAFDQGLCAITLGMMGGRNRIVLSKSLSGI
jgi:hypothetical protein